MYETRCLLGQTLNLHLCIATVKFFSIFKIIDANRHYAIGNDTVIPVQKGACRLGYYFFVRRKLLQSLKNFISSTE